MSRLFGSSRSNNSAGMAKPLPGLSNGFPMLEEPSPISVDAANVAAFSLPQDCLTFEPRPDSVITPFKNGDKERKIHCCIKLDEEELAALKALQEEAEREKASFIPSVSLMATRYISRARGDSKKALGLMQKTQEWRMSYFSGGAISEKSVMEDLQHGIVYWAGRDWQLRPFIVIRANRVPKKWYKDNSVDKMIRILVFCMEYYQRYMCVPGKIENNCVIVDLKGLGVTQVPISLLGEVYKVLNNYSGRVYRFYICNLSWGLKTISGAATAMLTDRQKQKMCFVDDKEDLLKDICRHHLEEDLGGTRPNVTNFFPFPLVPGPFDPSCKTGPSDNSVPNCHRVFTETGAIGFLWNEKQSSRENCRLEHSPEAPEILQQCGLPVTLHNNAVQQGAAAPPGVPEAVPENPAPVVTPVPVLDGQREAALSSLSSLSVASSSPELKAPAAAEDDNADDLFAPRSNSQPGLGDEGPSVSESGAMRPIESKLMLDEVGVKPKSFWSCGICWSSPSQ